MRQRADVAIGLLVAGILHGLVLAAAGSYLLLREGSEAREPRPALEIVLVEREAFESALEPDLLKLRVEPSRNSKRHRPPELPDWPLLKSRSTLPSSAVLRLPVCPEEFDEPVRSARPELEHPPAPLLTEHVADPPAEVESAPAPKESGRAGPVPMGDRSQLVIYRPELRYPARALRRGIEGETEVGIDVGPGGLVARAWVLESSGNRSLDRAALEYAQKFRFDAAAVAAACKGNCLSKRVRFMIQ